ncbi:DUF2231 domain-containing protein [Sediminitomix flava]|uniref:Putative membrane protein n=1 Tax=Sediminitomix flava TaxID=379075 RepID=A0A315ZAV4_SEDFL|nr:DUF2231 domain-containing protein [Sediminitomix flava]PWJ41854.1 putative membrane protein [Sediminitomix flava]
MDFSNFVLFLGRFHPLLVHFPIGFLLLAALFEVAVWRKWLSNLDEVIKFTLALGAISAIGASVLGLMLSTSGDYEQQMLDLHQWAGILTSSIAIFAFALKVKPNVFRENTPLIYGLVVFSMIGGLSFTGHLGGNLTHGSDYLTYYSPFNLENENKAAKRTITSIDEAVLFADLVQPIVEGKCLSCHNETKKKGKLSLGTIQGYLNGGKHGGLLGLEGSSSEFLKRIHLDADDKKVMPPVGKTPLTDEEVQLLTFWIEHSEASFDTLFMEVSPNEELKTIALAQLGLSGDSESINLPQIATSGIFDSLANLGIHYRELVTESNAYEVSIPPQSLNRENKLSTLKLLSQLKKNIVWLSISENDLENSELKLIGSFENLQKLKLNQNTKISDNGIAYLLGLSELKSINLFATSISKSGLEQLASLPKLERVYLWQTPIGKSELEEIKTKYTAIDFVGNVY